MQIDKVIEVLKHFLRHDVKTPIHLVGGPGVGKTSAVRQAIEAVSRESKTRLGLHNAELANFDVPDTRGVLIPNRITDAEGTKRLIGEWTYPVVMPPLGSPEHGVVFLDEFGQCSQDVAKPMATFLLEGRIGDFTTKWLRWAASNRLSDRAGVNRQLSHIRNRIITLEVTPNLTAWTTWAMNAKVHPMVIGFANFKPGLVFADKVPDGDTAFCTPRSLVAVCNLLMTFAPPGSMELPTGPIELELAGGTIGDGAAAELMVYLRLAEHLPKLNHILDDPTGAPIPKKPDVCFATAGMIMQAFNAETVEPLLLYVDRLPKEFQMVIMNAAIKSASVETFNTKAFSKWCANNCDLVIATADINV